MTEANILLFSTQCIQCVITTEILIRILLILLQAMWYMRIFVSIYKIFWHIDLLLLNESLVGPFCCIKTIIALCEAYRSLSLKHALLTSVLLSNDTIFISYSGALNEGLLQLLGFLLIV